MDTKKHCSVVKSGEKLEGLAAKEQSQAFQGAHGKHDIHADIIVKPEAITRNWTINNGRLEATALSFICVVCIKQLKTSLSWHSTHRFMWHLALYLYNGHWSLKWELWCHDWSQNDHAPGTALGSRPQHWSRRECQRRMRPSRWGLGRQKSTFPRRHQSSQKQCLWSTKTWSNRFQHHFHFTSFFLVMNKNETTYTHVFTHVFSCQTLFFFWGPFLPTNKFPLRRPDSTGRGSFSPMPASISTVATASM